MKTLTDPTTRHELLARIDRLSPDSVRRWGTMSIEQMLTHCAEQIRICLGERPCEPMGNALTAAVARFVVFNLPLPTFKNLRTAPELDPARGKMTKPTTFADDRQSLVDLVERLAGLPSDTVFNHPIFGRLDLTEMGKLAHYHIDHHLKQFGE
jgi:Protein of unknown function (DUF1569)